MTLSPCPAPSACLALLFIMPTQVLNSVSSTNLSSSWSRWNTGAGYVPASPPVIFQAKPWHWHLISGVAVHSRSPSLCIWAGAWRHLSTGLFPSTYSHTVFSKRQSQSPFPAHRLIDSPGRNKINQSSLNYPPIFKPPSWRKLELKFERGPRIAIQIRFFFSLEWGRRWLYGYCFLL